jgi:hypothetical protein
MCERALRAHLHGIPSPKSQVSLMLASPYMEVNSQLLGLEKPSKYGLYSLKSDLDYFMHKYLRDMLRFGSSFMLGPTLNTSPMPHLQKVFHVSTRVILGTWDYVWSGRSQLPYSQWLRLHGLTSNDLGLRTWDPCEPALRLAQKHVNITPRYCKIPWLITLGNCKWICIQPNITKKNIIPCEAQICMLFIIAYLIDIP